MLQYVSLIFLLIFLHSFIFYPRFISLISRFNRIENKYRKEISNMKIHSFHIILCVHNEEQLIMKKIKNTNEINFPANKLKISIISDGSTDKTTNIIKENKSNKKINLIEFKDKKGKSARQNFIIEKIEDDIVLYTDTDTMIDRNCLIEMNELFNQNNVGCVAAKVIFKDQNYGQLNESKQLYWSSETIIRKNESNLNMLATASGSCMAVRREIIDPISDDVGEDTVIPLIVINKNYLVLFSEKSLAYDHNIKSMISHELPGRIRMTNRGVRGTINYFPSFKSKYFFRISISLLSRKLLRWFSPFILLISFLFALLYRDGVLINSIIFYLFLSGFMMTLIGAILYYLKFNIRLFNLFLSFFVANIGFSIGIITYLFGKKIKSFNK